MIRVSANCNSASVYKTWSCVLLVYGSLVGEIANLRRMGIKDCTLHLSGESGIVDYVYFTNSYMGVLF